MRRQWRHDHWLRLHSTRRRAGRAAGAARRRHGVAPVKLCGSHHEHHAARQRAKLELRVCRSEPAARLLGWLGDGRRLGRYDRLARGLVSLRRHQSAAVRCRRLGVAGVESSRHIKDCHAGHEDKGRRGGGTASLCLYDADIVLFGVCDRIPISASANHRRRIISTDVYKIKEPTSIVLLCLGVLALPLFIGWMHRQHRAGKPALIPNSFWTNSSFATICATIALSFAVLNSLELFASL